MNSIWVTHPDIDPAAFNLIHLRNTFELNSVPEQFIVHVSGDNRYRLFVNEKEVVYGPQLGDMRHWRYETIDLAPFLKQGKNCIAAEVMNWGIERSYGIISFKTGFLLQGHSDKELIWIDMLHDMMMRFRNKNEIKGYLGEIDEVFDYYKSLKNEHGLVGKSEYEMFIDWYLPRGGNSEVNKDGNSAILTLNYAYTLKKALELLSWLGYNEKASYYLAQSVKYSEIVRKLCYDAEKGIYADDPEKTFYDQRASILAVLTGAHSVEEKKVLMLQLLDEKTHFDSYANLFYYFYLFEAMEETGTGNFTDVVKPWKEIADMGLTATPEKRIEQHPRSEVHPWTAHPVHFYFSYVAGIKPVKPGFREVEITPHPGDLTEIKANYPTGKGDISIDLNFQGENPSGDIVLPSGITGKLIWEGKDIQLTTGKNTIDL